MITQEFRLAPEERADIVDGGRAERMVDEWWSDVSSQPNLILLYQELSDDRLRPPTTADVEQHIKPRLRRALRSGELVALELPLFGRRPSKDRTEKGIHQRQVERPPPEPESRTERRTIRVISEKTFIDVQFVGDNGEPIAGRKYKIEFPDGRVEQATLASDGRIRKDNIDPGIGRVTLLAEKGTALTHDELPTKKSGGSSPDFDDSDSWSDGDEEGKSAP